MTSDSLCSITSNRPRDHTTDQCPLNNHPPPLQQCLEGHINLSNNTAGSNKLKELLRMTLNPGPSVHINLLKVRGVTPVI